MKKRGSFDFLDTRILYEINKNKDLGLIELAKKINISPKSLLRRIKKYEIWGWVKKITKPVKPSGRKRIYSLTESGKRHVKTLESLGEFFKRQQ
ncbi:MAG TPA: winged helix-turn-helix transcriptional regulator [Candidatus Paceibacterota bacterium]|nr:winged helix-turn-helix transcriptional regulator [Candidatus Paceibacterota bacterium]